MLCTKKDGNQCDGIAIIQCPELDCKVSLCAKCYKNYHSSSDVFIDAVSFEGDGQDDGFEGDGLDEVLEGKNSFCVFAFCFCIRKLCFIYSSHEHLFLFMPICI